MQISNNISVLQKERGWSQSKIAEKSGLNQASVSRYLSGKTEPKISDAAKLAAAFGVSMEWMLTGNGPRNAAEVLAGAGKFLGVSDPSRLAPEEVINRELDRRDKIYAKTLSAQETAYEDSSLLAKLQEKDCVIEGLKARLSTAGTTRRMIPMIGWAHAGEAADYEELPLDDQHKIPSECQDDQAFAVTLEGDSMEPKFSEGDMLVLMPNKRPYSGCLVVCRFSNDGVIFRRMQAVGDKIRLIALNRDYSPTEHDEDEFSWIYPVWGRWTQIWK